MQEKEYWPYGKVCFHFSLIFSPLFLSIAVSQRLTGITAVIREPAGPEDTPEVLEAEKIAAGKSH